MPPDGKETARDTAEAVARRSYGKLVAVLAARSGDVAGAEDALSEAFAAALVDWPANGIPDAPEAWLLTVARRRQIDSIRRSRSRTDAVDHLRLMAEEIEAATASRTALPDERLALMFACAHPAIDRAIRAPLILQTIRNNPAYDGSCDTYFYGPGEYRENRPCTERFAGDTGRVMIANLTVHPNEFFRTPHMYENFVAMHGKTIADAVYSDNSPCPVTKFV